MGRISLRERISEGLFLLDGAMGTELIARGIEAGTCNDYLNIESPDMIFDIHRAHIFLYLLPVELFELPRYLSLRSFRHSRAGPKHIYWTRMCWSGPHRFQLENKTGEYQKSYPAIYI